MNPAVLILAALVVVGLVAYGLVTRKAKPATPPTAAGGGDSGTKPNAN